jgi:hypothetical protein
MAWLGTIAAALLIVIILVDAFEALILPRRVRHSYRFARVYYQSTWFIWGKIAKALANTRMRHGFLSVFGPLSLFGLMGFWAVGLILGFALLHWTLDTAISMQVQSEYNFTACLYFSGTTFFTLGYGDIVPVSGLGRTLSLIEASIGFGFLALVLSYLPVLYQAFSRREIVISLLDARAGSPPSAGEMLQRMVEARGLNRIETELIEWERWSAELLENNLSFPVLRFYRSQHDNQSWLAALTVILDTTAFLISTSDPHDNYQARLTFAMARHAAVDLVLVSQIAHCASEVDRLPAGDLARLLEHFRRAGLAVKDEASVTHSLKELRGLYEPFVNALALYLQLALPVFAPPNRTVDNWQTSPGMKRSPSLSGLPSTDLPDEHED